MFFYVDESGHTGSNLFDPTQPVLYYGVVSSRLNIDLVGEDLLCPMRRQLEVNRLHAAELGNGRLVQVSSGLARLQKRLDLRFDLYRARKPDHAVISFFDQVFDQGMNPAVHWHAYWTPLRYVLLLKLAYLFDEPLAQRAWAGRLNSNDTQAEADLTSVCDELRRRLHTLPDARSREVLGNALEWAAQNPSHIRYNAKSQYEALAIAPNSIGFQSVMAGIARRILSARPKRVQVTVDRQSQFNKSQKSLAEFYANAKGVPLINGPGLPELDFRGMPDAPLRLASGHESAGLELTDVHLWVFKRYIEGKELAPELLYLIQKQLYRGRTDEISLESLSTRWSQWFAELPEPTPEQIEKGRQLQEKVEANRKAAISRKKQ